MAGIYSKAPRRPRVFRSRTGRNITPYGSQQKQGQQAPPGGWTDWNQQTGRGSPEDNWTPAPGEGVQDYINRGQIKWPTVKNLGYTPPPPPGQERTGSRDPSSFINGDWEVQDAEARMAAGMARARGDFQAQLRQALIDLGIGDIKQLGSLGKYIDPETIKKAIENKYSSNAQITKAAETGRARNNAALAARGILNSGETRQQQQTLSGEAESQRYTALRGFLEGGAQGLTGLADLEAQWADRVAQARFAAAARAAGQYPGEFGDEGGGGGMIPPILNNLNNAINPNYRGMLSRRQWMAKNPKGNYANYQRAYRRRNPYGI